MTLPASIAAPPESRLLVLCRTPAQVASTRARLAAAGGAAGVAVATLESLADEVYPLELPPQGDPPASPLLDRIAGRPGLLDRALEHAASAALHIHPVVGGSLSPGERMGEVAMWSTSEWVAPSVAARSWLLHRLAERRGAARPGPTDVTCFDAVLTVGFDVTAPDEPAFLSRWSSGESTADPVPLWQRKALELLGARPASEEPWTRGVVAPSISVPDPPAAARLAALLLLGEGADALVLVPDESTAARVAGSARRNGLAVGELEAAALASHALAGAVRHSCRWFAGGHPDPRIRASDLDAVLTHPLVGARFPAALEAALGREVGRLVADDEGFSLRERPARMSRREVRRALQDARIVEAPLSIWLSRLKALESVEAKDGEAVGRLRRGARLLRARLERLGDCLAGRAWADADSVGDDDLATSADVDVQAGAAERSVWSKPPEPGTLGAARRFLLDCGLRVWDDPVGGSLLGALREAASEPADEHGVAAVLGGRARTGRLVAGIQILRYEDYDGRPSGRLVLLGVHGKGLGAAAVADPLLNDGELASIGTLGGRSGRLFRLMQARRALARADRPFAIVARRDSTGRAVTPPLELDLDLEGGRVALRELGLDAAAVESDSYGLDLPLPETASRRALVVSAVIALSGGEFPSDERGVLADQSTAEWCRSGRGPRPGSVSTSEDDGTLAGLLDGLGPLGPARLAPWLGEIGPPPAGSTDWLGGDGSWSVSRHFTPLTNCLFRFFVERVLLVRQDEEISDELDPSEIGTSVHGALEEANQPGHPGVLWRVPAEDLETAQKEAVVLLGRLADTGFDEALDALGHTDRALDVAADGLRSRWRAQWPKYAAGRVRGVEGLRRRHDDQRTALVGALPELDAALEAFRAEVEADPAAKSLGEWCGTNTNAPRKWIVWAGVSAQRGVDLTVLSKKELSLGPSASRATITQAFDGVLRRLLLRPEFRALVDAAHPRLASLETILPILSQPASAVEAELPFGRNAAASPSRPGLARLQTATLRLGEREVPVSGAIDRVLVVQGPEGGLAEVLDYKTGSPPSRSELVKKVHSLELPQLPVYGLVLEAVLATGGAVGQLPSGTSVAAWGYDYVRQADAGKGLIDGNLYSNEDKARTLRALDRLFQRTLEGSFPPVPLRDQGFKGGSSWGWPKGAVSLRDVSRFEAMVGEPEPSEEEASNDAEGSES